MRVLVYTNVVLDLLLDRPDFADAAAEIFSMVEDGTVAGYLGATTVTTVFYLASRALGPVRAREEIGKLLALFEVAPVTRAVLETALAGGFADFEDAVLHEAACHAGAEAIVTRNAGDFRSSRIPVFTSADFVKAVAGLR